MSSPRVGREARTRPPAVASLPDVLAADHPSTSHRASLAIVLSVGCVVGLALPCFASDSDAVLAVSSRFGWAQACAIGPDLALTAAHVVDPEPTNPSVPYFPARYEAEDGTVGVMTPIAVDSASDTALVRLSWPVRHWHTLSAVLPVRGEEVKWYGYDWRKRSNVAALREFKGKVVRVKAGDIWLDEGSEAGTSGSCVENDKHEVVGLLSRGLGTDDGREATSVVAVGGVWASEVERLKVKAIKPAKPEEKP